MTGRGLQFEDEIEATFEAYDRAHYAQLMRVPVPTKIIGFKDNRPLIVLAGKAPFDVVGFMCHDATMIGAELKDTKLKNSLPVVAPGKHGDGLQYHQLSALASLAEAGGVARLVWRNGGAVGVLRREAILAAYRTYEQARQSELSGKSVPRGAKSIPWERFLQAGDAVLGGLPIVDWLEAKQAASVPASRS